MKDVKWMWKGVNKAISNITIEPLIALYMISNALCELAMQNLNLDKACRVNLQFGDQVCDALNRRETANYTREDVEVQKLVSEFAGYGRIVQSILVAVLVLIWGSWSDKYKRRKPVILIPLVSELCRNVGLIVCTYVKNAPVQATISVEMIVSALGGGWVVVLMAVFSYIADITTAEDRTWRIGLASMFFHIAYPIGASMSGILIRAVGFYGVFSISSVLTVICLLYGLFCLKEPRTEDRPESIGSNIWSKMKNFFDIRGVMDCIRVVTSAGPDHKRLKAVYLALIIFFCVGPIMGEWTVMYLFTRNKFNWSEIEFSLYTTFSSVVGLVGTIFGSVVLAKIFNMNDALIGVLSCISRIASSVLNGLANTVFVFYWGPVIDILSGNIFISMRSFATKLVGADDLGKMNAVFGSVEALIPFISAPIYTRVYGATLSTYPGVFFFVTAVSVAFATIVFGALYILHRRSNGDTQSVAKIEATTKS